MMVVVVALDSFQSSPFAYLRYKKRPVKFAAIKLINIVGNIGLNLFFLLLCPWLHVHAPGWISWFYDPAYMVGYIFVSNLIMSALQMFFFIPELRGFSYRIDRRLMKQMISYSFPILIFGVVGILNQTIDKMIYPFLFDDRQEGLVQLGIYSATSKVALIMAMFTQAFRYAYEPFVFGKNKDADNKKVYAAAMKYLRLLQHTLCYRRWAEARMPGRQTEAVKRWLEDKRRLLPVADTLRLNGNVPLSLRHLIEACPDNTMAVHSLLCFDLLNKDIDAFIIDYQRYGAALPQARLYSEAILIYLAGTQRLAEQADWKIPAQVLAEFKDYTRMYEANGGNGTALQARYRHTYWFYFHYATMKN